MNKTPAPTLAEQQRNLRAWLRSPNAKSLIGISGSRHMSADQCAGIYRDSILEIHLRALDIMFPVLKRLMGDMSFRSLGKKFLQTEVSRSPNLTDLGRNFPSFIDDFAPLRDWPYFADTARLELYFHQAQEGADPRAFDWDALRQLTQESTRLRFHLAANARLLESPFPVDSIWRTNQPNAEEDRVVQLDEGPVQLIVWRPHDSVLIERLDEATWTLLRLIDHFDDFELLCGEMVARHPDIDLGNLLTHCIQRNWIDAFSPTGAVDQS